MQRTTTAVIAIILILATVFAGCKDGDAAGKNSSEAKGVVQVPGLNIKDLAVGDGRAAAKGDFVTVHYTGWVYTGGQKAAEPFDSSVTRGVPATFPIGTGRLIKGWDEGIPGMKVGGKRELILEPAMGYGERDTPKIPANSTLIFEVELVAIPEVQMADTATGSGPAAESGDVVQVHYTGWLMKDGVKGEKFDSSLDRGSPFEFQLDAGRVIPGWDIGVKGMKVGGKRTLTIPPELGYGDRDLGVIPPNSTLTFDVELLGVQGKVETPAGQAE